MEDNVPLDGTPPTSGATSRRRRPGVPAAEQYRLRITGEAASDEDKENQEEPEVVIILA